MLSSLFRLVSLLILMTVSAGCAITPNATAETGPWQNWVVPSATLSPLQGKIWSTRDNEFISPERLADAMSGADYALLGETHDNADHHRLQAWMIRAIAARGRRPAVVWEMIDTDQSAALADYLASNPANASELGKAIGWEKTGWPKWPLYQPVAEAALAAKLPMFAGDPPATLVRKAGMESFAVLRQGQTRALRLDTPLDDGLKAALQSQIVKAHCNLVPSSATGPMFRGQRLRDATIAMRMVQNGTKDGTILIAGSGHVRLDRAVPWYLRRHNPSASIASLMFIGVTAGDKEPQTLIPKGPDGEPAADYAWYTPKVVREDPCIALKKRFGK